VRAGGAVPATVAVVDGQPRIGLDDDALERVAGDPDVAKVSVRDLAVIAARGGVGATTVASTAHLAARARIRVFATGGLGGVHRGARDTWDESADLTTLSRTPVLVVCAGVKSILDVAATIERLETLNVGVLGYRTDRFPGFYLRDSGHPLFWAVDSPGSVADVLRAQDELGTDVYGLVLTNPIAAEDELDRALHDRVLAAGLAAADAAGVRGKDVTPFLLDFFHRETHGASLAANVALVLSNARLAAEVAAAYCAG
jgi:pseudouridine-5'-phosphate glycosidase